ncbi:S41 family peptidase [Chitinophaga arvensicola]|uniref:Peptidase family S41 n=1 Tax=Chitinophaga arvensicola TaxID=29529 RepID=A0A1I0S4U5_9BACT|nr:S41 family peptidase [Chitinophaga arvensicola]SEW49810.1 Peptidase family S41 [Chitinophaga arvensicola]
MTGRRHTHVLFFGALLAALFTGCSTTYLLDDREAARKNISPAALHYFNDAFVQVRNQSIRKKDIDFKQLYQASLAQMGKAVSWQDTYPAIQYLLAGLNDHHSFFHPPAKEGSSLTSILSNKTGSIPFNARIDGGYGILELKSYNSVDHADQHRIADSLYTALKKMDDENIKGLIIDFRKMEGGSTVPFLTGFAPLINQDILLKYVDKKGHVSYITRYKNGIYTKSGHKTARLGYLSSFAPLKLSRKPIAIIMGHYTASAGEMILISFLGLPQVKTFGTPTYGVATGKSNIFLADSAFISLASSVTCDRKGRSYPGPISPDQYTDSSSVSEDQLMNDIRRWIR